MPLYDCMLLVKPLVIKESAAELVARVARRAYQRNGVVTDLKSFGTVHLGYGIKKLDGRHFQVSTFVVIPRVILRNKVTNNSQGQLMQMTMMVPPSFTQELHNLNKEDRLLRWLVVKHRDAVYGLEFINEYDGRNEMNHFYLHNKDDDYDNDGDADEFDYNEDDCEYEVEEE